MYARVARQPDETLSTRWSTSPKNAAQRILRASCSGDEPNRERLAQSKVVLTSFDHQLPALEGNGQADDEGAEDTRLARRVLVRDEVAASTIDVQRVQLGGWWRRIVRAQRLVNL